VNVIANGFITKDNNNINQIRLSISSGKKASSAAALAFPLFATADKVNPAKASNFAVYAVSFSNVEHFFFRKSVHFPNYCVGRLSVATSIELTHLKIHHFFSLPERVVFRFCKVR